MGKVSRSIDIAASPDAVFNFVNDTDKMNMAHEGFVQVHYTSKGPVGVGTTAHFVGNQGGSRLEWDAEITEFEQNKRVTWNALPPNKMTMIFDVEPIPNGARLTNYAEYEVPYSVIGKLVDKLKVSKDVEKESVIWLERAKKALEEQALLTSTH